MQSLQPPGTLAPCPTKHLQPRQAALPFRQRRHDSRHQEAGCQQHDRRGSVRCRRRHPDRCGAAAGNAGAFASPGDPQQPGVEGLGGADLPAEEEAPDDTVQVFSRARERDPYRLLGVDREASFEEVQDARNFLYEEYKGHERSRESIELAYDAILKETMKTRHKYGFRPPRGSRSKTSMAAQPLDEDVKLMDSTVHKEHAPPSRHHDQQCSRPASALSIALQKQTLMERLRDRVEPSVPLTSIVNDGVIFVALGIWSAMQVRLADPTLPLGAAFCFCAWRLFSKRKARTPEGPWFGNSPVWGALATSLAALLFGGLASWTFVNYAPFPASWQPEAVGVFGINLILAAASLFIR